MYDTDAVYNNTTYLHWIYLLDERKDILEYKGPSPPSGKQQKTKKIQTSP
jgi:hypothetical protein